MLWHHYTDVIMTTMASQITSLTVVYSTVYSDADQRKHQSSASLAFVWGIHRDRWIPRTKGQLRGKCFHLMTSSWQECSLALSNQYVQVTHCGLVTTYGVIDLGHMPVCFAELCHDWFRWWLVACLLPSNYLNQWWLLINFTPWNSFLN